MPQSAVRPQAAINQQLTSKCDILLGMFWTRLGTHTGVAESGAVEEIDQFVAAGKPALLYFSNRPIAPDKIDPQQHQKLREFQEETYEKALVGHFTDLKELHQTLLRDLMNQVRALKSSSNRKTEKEELTLPDEILGVLSATYPGYQRATVIKEQLEKRGHDMNKYRNPLAIIHMVLKLLMDAKKVETAENRGGQKLYRVVRIADGAAADPCTPNRT